MEEQNQLDIQEDEVIIRKMLVEQNLSIDQVTNELVQKGLDREKAYAYVFSIAKDNQEEIFESQRTHKLESNLQFAFILGNYILLIFFIFVKADSSITIFVLSGVSSAMFFMLKPSKGILYASIGFICTWIFYCITSWYMSGRENFILIEFFIPMAIGIVLFIFISSILIALFPYAEEVEEV